MCDRLLPLSFTYILSYEEGVTVIVNNLVSDSAPVDKENKQRSIRDKPEGEDTKEDNEDRTQTDENTGEDTDEDTNSDYIY